MEPNYIRIEKDNRIIQFCVDIERRFAYSEYSMDYFESVMDMWIPACHLTYF
jgi:hypothetical protein